ncbi:Shr3 amino acid permease chaperone [Neolentinus lepideus HHB14362 ss-1]|uniref:Shr3 amino acid permease chaperone n=1 Tax=Neolentinus lepideus HHB14362 ss-1 TaxID=1314782 RepID=A0A165U862_9AGAM|nr:Shr3 amino acid permease chaperone [Neolentinus lepideus HHB14362 ss-1]
MGFRQAAVLTSVCFFLGVLFICLNVDYRLLFHLNQQAVEDGFQFYTTFYNAPPAIKAMLYGMGGVGMIGLLSKVTQWDESAMFFDGSSLAAYMFSIALYFTVTIPSAQTIVDPVPDVDTREDQIEAMRVLSASNTIAIVLLGGILALQAGQEYARRIERREMAKLAELEGEGSTLEVKKDQ